MAWSLDPNQRLRDSWSARELDTRMKPHFQCLLAGDQLRKSQGRWHRNQESWVVLQFKTHLF